MDEAEARDIDTGALVRIAPDVDPAAIDATGDLRVEADLDSLDFLELLAAVGAATGRDIPEEDYPRIATLEDFGHYLVTTS
jgi:acyl carrier protein